VLGKPKSKHGTVGDAVRLAGVVWMCERTSRACSGG